MVSLDIDPRGFVLPERPQWAQYGVAYDLWGTAQSRWRYWYREKRMERKGVFAPITGEIGRVEGFRFYDA